MKKINSPFAPFSGKNFSEISPDDVATVIQNLYNALRAAKTLLLGAAAGIMGLRVVSVLRAYLHRQELARIIDEKGLDVENFKPTKALRLMQKKRYRRYKRIRKIVKILTPKKKRKSAAFKKGIAVMNQLHPKKGW